MTPFTVIQPAEAARLNAAASRASLRDLERHKEATGRVLQTLEAEQDKRCQPFKDRKAELRTAIETLRRLEDECDEAISAIEDDMRPAIDAARADDCAAFDELWDSRREARRV